MKDNLYDILAKEPKFSHHPACKFYSNHILWIRNVPFCLGHFGMISGIGLGSVLLFSFNFINWWLNLIIGICLYLPTLAQIKFKLPKVLKLISRGFLGVGIVFQFTFIYLLPWDLMNLVLKIILLIIFWKVRAETLKLRGQNLDNPCINCEEGIYPFCNYKRPYIEKLIDNNEISDVIMLNVLKGYIRNDDEVEITEIS